MSAPVFGEADPKDYMEPLCVACNHVRTDHQGDMEGLVPCWHGWGDDKRGDGAGGDGDRGCECLNFVAPERKP